MPRHVDLGDHLDTEFARERDDAGNRLLAVKAATALSAGAELRRNGQSNTAPGADTRKLWKSVDLNPPGLILRKMPVEAVQLVPGENTQELFDLACRKELAGDIEMATRQAIAGSSSMLPAAGKTKCWRNKRLPRKICPRVMRP